MLAPLLIAGGCALLQRPRLLQASAPQSLRLAASPLAQAPAAAPAPAAAQPPASSGKKGKGRLNIRIDDEWYDLTNWRAAHPAGTHWIDAYNNSDATEVMYAFHSDKVHRIATARPTRAAAHPPRRRRTPQPPPCPPRRRPAPPSGPHPHPHPPVQAISMFKRLPNSRAPPEGIAPPSASTYAFRELRQRLVEEGWFKIHPLGELQKLAPWSAVTAAGVWLARRSGFWSAFAGVVCLAIGNSLAGWLSHDYVHGRQPFAWAMRGFGELIGGMSTTWWSNKHNMHHALTNEVGYDEDIALDPALHLRAPDPRHDTLPWLRQWQHVYWPLPYSILFLYWRFDSIRYVLKDKKWGEAARLAAHWAAFSALVPFRLLLASVWLSGLITATIVTVTHQSEEIFLGDTLRKYDFVEAQFRSTRDAKCNNWFSDVLWGGMQWQLEHHLFPTMPRYRYPALSKVLAQFASENDLTYRVTGEFKIIGDNVALLKKIGQGPQQPGNPNSEPLFKQV